MRTAEFDDVVARARDCAAELRHALADLGARAAREGRQQARERVRRAIGAPSGEAVWTALAIGLAGGLLLGLAFGVLLSGRSPRESRDRVSGDLEEAREGLRVAAEAPIEEPLPVEV